MSAKRKDLIIGITLAFTAAIAYGVKDILVKRGVTGMTSPMVGAAISLLWGSVILGINCLRVPEGNIQVKKKGVLFFLLAGAIGGFSVASTYFALSVAPVVIVNPIVNTSPLVALFLSSLFLRKLERITPRIIMGTILVIAGATLIVIGRQA